MDIQYDVEGEQLLTSFFLWTTPTVLGEGVL